MMVEVVFKNWRLDKTAQGGSAGQRRAEHDSLRPLAKGDRSRGQEISIPQGGQASKAVATGSLWQLH